MQMLELVENIISKFPVELVEANFAVFFLPLSARLSAEPSAECRKRLSATLATLLRRVGAGSRSHAAEWCQKWLASWDSRLRAVAAQVRSLALPLCLTAHHETHA
jgi:hypothetical protein